MINSVTSTSSTAAGAWQWPPATGRTKTHSHCETRASIPIPSPVRDPRTERPRHHDHRRIHRMTRIHILPTGTPKKDIGIIQPPHSRPEQIWPLKAPPNKTSPPLPAQSSRTGSITRRWPSPPKTAWTHYPFKPHRTATPIQLRHPEHCKNPSHPRVAFLYVNKHVSYYNPPGVAIRQRPVNQESLFYLCVPLGRVLMFCFSPVLLILCSNPAFQT